MTEKYTPSKGDYIDLKGKKYLPARRRVQWFRGEHPDWTITTSVVELDWQDGHAVIRADVLNEQGRLIASGMKSETRKGFADFVEKAETGAIARAVAIAGYGTEDALDLDDEGIADSPVVRQSQPEQRGAKASPGVAAPARTPEEQALIGQLLELPGMSIARMRLLADAVGIPKGSQATADQLREMLSRAEQPGSGVPTHPADGEAGLARDSASPPTPSAASTPSQAGPMAATDAAPDSPPGAALGTHSFEADDRSEPKPDEQQAEQGLVKPATSSPAASFADPDAVAAEVARVTGGTVVEGPPPRPNSAAYHALPDGVARSQAKAYWDVRKDPEPEQASLAEQLGGVAS